MNETLIPTLPLFGHLSEAIKCN